MGSKYIGGLEEIVMLAVQSLGREAYGVSIHQALKEAHRSISIGSLYITLGRLEEKGYLTSRTGETGDERGGRVKRYFALTGEGAAILVDTQESRDVIKSLHGGRPSWAN